MLKYQWTDITKDANPGAGNLSPIVPCDPWHQPLRGFLARPLFSLATSKEEVARMLSLGAVQLPARGCFKP